MSYKNFRDPQDMPCWETCTSCNRCANKGLYAACDMCSGRCDPRLVQENRDIDDRCRCPESILQYRTKKGVLVKLPLQNNPFAGTVTTEPDNPDKRDWQRFLQEERERRDDPYYTPLFTDDGKPIYE